MKRKLKTLILCLLIPVLCFSQTIYQIDSNSDTIVSVPYEMIKQANVVFVERDMYHEESLLWKNISQIQDSVISNYIQQNEKLELNSNLYQREVAILQSDLEKQKKRQRKAVFKSGLVGVIVGIITGCSLAVCLK